MQDPDDSNLIPFPEQAIQERRQAYTEINGMLPVLMRLEDSLIRIQEVVDAVMGEETQGQWMIRRLRELGCIV